MNTTTRPLAPYIIGLAVTAILIAISYSLFFVPKIEAGLAFEKQTSEQKVVNGQLQAQVAEVEERKKNTAKLTASVAEFNKAFPPGASQHSLLAGLAKAAADAGVTLTGVNPEPPVLSESEQDATTGETAVFDPEADPALAPAQAASGAGVPLQSDILAQVTLTLNASGTRSNLETFTAKLEGMDRPIKLRSVALDGEGSLATGSFTATTYFVAPLDPPASESAKK